MKPQPPKYALKFLRWFCKEDFIEEIEGDLIELFEIRAEEAPGKAKRKFFADVLLHFRPEYIRHFSNNQYLINSGMIKNYFIIAWRSIVKQKLYSSINIGGLAVGITSFLLIFLYIQHETSFDTFYGNSDQIYRVYQQTNGYSYRGTDKVAATPVGLAPAMVEDFPEVLDATTIRDHQALLSYGGNHFYEPGIRADVLFPRVFKLKFIDGDPLNALKNDRSLVLTQSLAKKMFGHEDPMGKTILYHNRWEFTVTGLIQDIPTNSSLEFTFLSPMVSSSQYKREMAGNRWNNNDYHTFFTLRTASKPDKLEAKFPAFLKKHMDRKEQNLFHGKYYVQPLSDLYFADDMNFDIGKKGNAKFVSLFSVVAILVLLLACVNYMNLAIARSMKRASEVGVRKVIGATRGQLIGQFLGESILIALIAMIFAMVLTHYLTPVFGRIMESNIEFDIIQNLYLLPGLFILVILIGVISGSYPAFLMSSLRPIQVLKGKITSKISGIRLQRFLIISQYAVSITLIICSLIIYQQYQYIQDKELGYSKDHVLTVTVFDRGLREKADQLETEWMTNPNILSFTTAAELPSDVTSGTMIRHIHQEKEERFNIYRARVDYNYVDAFGLNLITGRTFSREIGSDRENAIILNEKAVKAFGWTPEEAVGKQVQDHKTRTIIGVVKDFHMHSMHLEIAPLMLQMHDGWFQYIGVKVNPQNLAETITFMEESMRAHSPYPFAYQFLDERFNQLYRNDRQIGEMLGFLTILTIIIASMGLFGLAAFTAEQKSKEIGIRKVLGASVNSIIGMLSRDFLKMVIIGFGISIPFAWYFMDQWLSDYAYRTEIQWWLFMLAGGLAMLIAFMTISFQAYHAATANPIESLKDE
jgi:putative ABC transport system permease protein